MPSKFIVKKTPIIVEIKYLDANGNVIVIGNEELKKTLPNLKTLKATFKRPNNKLFNLSLQGCVKSNEFGENFLDKAMYNDKRFKILFQYAIDGDGEKIKPEDIDDLMPDLTNVLIEQLDIEIEKEKINVLKKYGIMDEEGNFINESKEESVKIVED